jgi:hypothetical protein
MLVVLTFLAASPKFGPKSRETSRVQFNRRKLILGAKRFIDLDQSIGIGLFAASLPDAQGGVKRKRCVPRTIPGRRQYLRQHRYRHSIIGESMIARQVSSAHCGRLRPHRRPAAEVEIFHMLREPSACRPSSRRPTPSRDMPKHSSD